MRIVPLALVVACTATAFGQDTATRSTAERVESVCERLEALAAEHHAPGMGLAIVTPDGVFTRGIGLADLEGEVPATADTLFEIGSTTKTFTSLLVARLVDLGQMSFDDPVRDHIPYFHLHDPKADENVLIRDLLSHRTGLTRTDVMLSGGDQLTVEDVLRNLVNCEPMAPFRGKFLYNNQMFQAAGTAAEGADGGSYAELVGAHLFTPLGMDSSTAELSEAIDRDTMSQGYRWLSDEEGYELIPSVGIPLSAPAGSILSSPRDMARYLSFLLARGTLDDGESLISRSLFEEELWTPQIAIGGGNSYGLGFMLTKWEGHKMAFHGGNIDGYTSQMAVLIDEGVGFSLVVNCAMSVMQNESTQVVFGELLGEGGEGGEGGDAEEAAGGAEVAAEELDQYVGDYDFAEAMQIWTVLLNDAGRLALQIPQQGTAELLWPDEQDRWALAPAPHISIEFNEEDGAVQSFTLRQPPAVITMKRRVAAEGLPSLEEVLAKIDAAAPREAIEGIAPLRATARVEMPNQGLSGSWIMQYQDAEHWRTDIDFGKFGRIINVLDDENSWSYVGLVGYREMSDAERAEAAQGSPFATVHAAEAYEEMSVQGVQGEGDDSVVLLKLVPKYGEPSILHIEMKTGNTRRIETGSSLGEIGAIPVNIKMSDHRRQHGFSYPFKIEVSNSFTGATRILLEEIETGVTLPEDVFERDDG